MPGSTQQQPPMPEDRLETQPSQSRWAKQRGAVIAYFVFFNALAALPAARDVSIERLERPFEREELSRWASVLTAVGFDTDPERLASGYLAFSQAASRARSIVLAPIAGWFDLTQTGQDWHLFGTPGRSVSALRVTAHSAAGDEVLFESGNAARRWNAAFLEYRRIRALYKPSRRGPPATYAAFAERLSRQLFEERPEVDRVSVALVQSHVRLPGEPPAAEGQASRPEHVLTFERLRP